MEYDFSGWATRNNIKCSDGRTILKDAFANNNGDIVPLVWNHAHNDPSNVLGHALLENRNEGVYAYCTFNDSESGQQAKELVMHGDISALSIYANKLKQQGGNVLHGAIREVSLVLAGANPGAYIDSIMAHGEESDEEAIIYTGENIFLSHTDDSEEESKKEEKEMEKQEKTIGEIFDTLNEEQKNAVYAIIGQALEDAGNAADDEEDDEEDKGGKQMKHNVFDEEELYENVLTHSDEQAILSLAKSSSVGSFKDALDIYAENNDVLSHGIDDIEELFPDYKDVYTGEPETLRRDQSWVQSVISKTHKSPYSRIRTRFADARGEDLRAFGYAGKGKYKKEAGNLKLLKRTTDPQTIYRKDALHRDDIVDITDFDVVNYQYSLMKENLYEEIALAIMIGDGRDEADEMKISEDHVRSIWNDDDLYCIHADIDLDAAKASLQGDDTSKHFGDEYVYAEAIVINALYAREKYKGSGNLEFYCTPHTLNVMLLARDLNGRRIYNSVADVAAALNVSVIHTVEQFENKTRTTAQGATKKLAGLFVNLADYQVGSTKGGEITKFNQFDIDFNQEKFLIETRMSGALTKPWSAIALEIDA